jgi:hypothetical protein
MGLSGRAAKTAICHFIWLSQQKLIVAHKSFKLSEVIIENGEKCCDKFHSTMKL